MSLESFSKVPLILAFSIASAMGIAASASAAVGRTAMESEDSNRIAAIQMGFDGKVVLGRWLPLAIRISGEVSSDAEVKVEVLDGDAVPVAIRWTPRAFQSEADGTTLHGLVRVGRRGGVTVTIEDGDTVLQRRFALSELQDSHEFLPAATRLSLVMGLVDRSDADRLSVASRDETAFAVIDGTTRLPDDWIGYESVERLVVLTESPNGLPMKPSEVAALDQWLRTCGEATFFCGANAPAWFDGNVSLTQLGLPPLREVRTTRRTGPLELLVNSTVQLAGDAGAPPLSYCVFENVASLTGADQVMCRIESEPVLFTMAHGLGHVTVLACNILEEPLTEWSGTRNLTARALMQDTASEDEDRFSRSGRVTHNGYDDMSGQLRSALDQFRNVTFISFTTVALLIGLFILLIGPADYFLLKRGFKRMEYTWLTFTLLSVVFCALAVYVASSFRSHQIEINQAEIVDIDAENGTISGVAWFNVYAPRTDTLSFQVGESGAVATGMEKAFLTWQGLAGSGLGGMQNRSDLGLYRREYESPLNDFGTSIEAMPFQTASTRSLTARWHGRYPNVISGDLRQSPNTDALLGTLANPTEVALRNCVVLYGDWAYVIDGVLEPGALIDVQYDAREKTLRGYFTRTKKENSNDEVNLPWDTADTDLQRILSAMMVFDSIGAEQYTTLSNDVFSWTDSTDALALGRAVLIGFCEEPACAINVIDRDDTKRDRQTTAVRITFPVQRRDSN